MSRYARIFFFLLLISIPIQLGKHFWPSFSFVQGIRVDYLSPTLYVSDCFFVGLLIFSLKELKSTLFIFCKSPVGITLIATLLASSFFAQSYEAALLVIIKFSEFFYLAVYVSHTFRKRDLELTLFILILGALTQSVILILQFFDELFEIFVMLFNFHEPRLLRKEALPKEVPKQVIKVCVELGNT